MTFLRWILSRPGHNGSPFGLPNLTCSVNVSPVCACCTPCSASAGVR